MKSTMWAVFDLNPEDEKDLNRFVIIPPHVEQDDNAVLVGEFTNPDLALDWVAEELERLILKALNG